MLSQPRSLADIPEDVFYCGILPLLDVNKVLDLRLVCKSLKLYAERYLHHNTPSERLLRINLGGEDAEEEDVDGDDYNYDPGSTANYSSLASFLQEDRASTIRMPVYYFSLVFKNSKVFESDPDFPEFLEKYGRQIEFLQVTYLSIPASKCEVDFYERLPRLKSLDVCSYRKEHFFSELAESLPSTFGSLKFLRLPDFRLDDEDTMGENYKFKLFECSKTLMTLHLHRLTQDLVEFQILCGILKRRTSLRFGFYCWEENPADPYPWNSELSSELCKLVGEGGTMLEKFPAGALFTLDIPQLNQISGQIISLLEYQMSIALLEDFCETRVVFPNVEEIEIIMSTESELFLHQVCPDHNLECDIGNILKKCLCPEMFCGVKKFTIYLPDCSRLSRALSLLWQFFPNLEELRFKAYIEDITFIGGRGQLPFLGLTKLRKLDLGKLDEKLTDAAFILVFRNMRIREFRMESTTSLTTITKSGIRALLTGPFYETIEKFPFKGWSLADASADEHHQLSLKFRYKQTERLEQFRYHCNLALYQTFGWYKYLFQDFTRRFRR